MAIPLTMDETLLCLDLLFQHDRSCLSEESSTMSEFSALLNQLPIIPQIRRREGFRSPGGLRGRINTFDACIKLKEYAVGKYNAGDAFYQAYRRYKNQPEELHAVAEAIKRNLPHYANLSFGAEAEQSAFPEGALLGHLHRHIEQRDRPQGDVAVQCAVCHIDPNELYQGLSLPLEPHLLEPLTKLDPNRRYTAHQYIWVCPNCHAALHQSRPWRSKVDCESILR